MVHLLAGGRLVVMIALIIALLIPVAIHAQAPAADADRALQAANSIFERGQWSQALEQYEQFLQANPQHPETPSVLYRAAECNYNVQRYEQAVSYYQRLITDYAGSPVFEDALSRLGDANFKLERFTEARQAFQTLLDKSPEGPLAYRTAYWLGETQYRLGQYPDAIASYEKSLQLDADGNYIPYTSYSIALAQLKLGKTKEGVQRLEALLQKYPKHELTPEVLYRLGEALYAAKDYAAAITRYQQVLKDFPGTKLAPLAQSGIAWSYWDQEKYTNALTIFQNLATTDDKVLATEASLRVADCLYLLQRFDEAATAYGQVATRSPEFMPSALFWQAMSLERKPDKAAALKTFQDFVAQYPQHERVAEAHLHLGALQVDAGQLEAAEKSYRTAADTTADATLKSQAAYGAAWANYERTKSEQALGAVEAIALNDPASDLGAQVAFQTGKLRLSRGDYDRAIELLSCLVEHHPQDAKAPEALYLIGSAYEKTSNPAKAEGTYKRILTEAPQSEAAADAGSALAGLYARTGQLEAARAAVADVKQKHPNSKSLALAQYAVAEALLAARDYAAAARYYESVLQSKNTDLAPYAQYSLGACKFGQGEYKAAADAFRTAITTYPQAETLPAARYQLAITLGKLGQSQDEAKLLEELLATNAKPELAADVLVELGWAYLEQKQAPQALATFEKLVQTYPDSQHLPEAFFRIGEIRYDQGNFPAAQVAYEKLLANSPNHELADEATYKLGWALLKQDKGDEAVKYFSQAATIAEDPAVNADARYQGAALYLKTGKLDEAVKLLQPVADKLPKALAPRALLLLAQSYLGLGTADKAEPVFRQIIDSYPADTLTPLALLGLGRCRKVAGKLEEAAVTFAKVIAGKDSLAAMEAQFELAETRRLQADFRTAAAEYLKVALYPNPEWAARAQYAAGLCFEQARTNDEAVKAYKVVIEKYKEQTEWAKKAEERLKALQ